ncbi:AraC family transcriptional regulator [Paenibacillus albidus]|uniref:AraC family transcriptional regulator n=1 Tax=Paenibacillus albidus TaxID=2041023 RepID=A0A917C258_9BACL|nr:Ada metal-binding domain-containing protein [Paenibacillus albidus]GGF66353.1 AraC family transcriptional regulator [Paenibacillus albidus]
MNPLMFDEVYQSVVRRDPTYDGVYYTGVRTTRIVCRPSCRARTPKASNVTFYTSLEEAVHAGFRPCKRCRPDAGGRLGPDAVLAAQADTMLEARFAERLTLQSLAEPLGVSPFHLQRTYKRITGQSPAARLDQIRLNKARELLKDSGLTVADIGKAVGLRGPSHFAAWFQRKAGLAPTEYRIVCEGGNKNDAEHIPSHPEAGE